MTIRQANQAKRRSEGLLRERRRFYKIKLFAFRCQLNSDGSSAESLHETNTGETFSAQLVVCMCLGCYTGAMQNHTRVTQTSFGDRIPVQAIKYGLAAFGGFVADYAALLALKEWAGLHYLVAVPIAFLIGIAVNYLIGIWIVFRRGKLSLAKELALFLTISLLALAITEGSMFLLTDLFRIDYRISRLISGVVTYLFNFFSRRFLIYRTIKGENRIVSALAKE